MTGLRMAGTVAALLLMLTTGCTGDDSPAAEGDTPVQPSSDPTPEPTTRPVACPRPESQASGLVDSWRQVVAAQGAARAKQAKEFAADVDALSTRVDAGCRGDAELAGLQFQASEVGKHAQHGQLPRNLMGITATTGNAWLAAIKVKDQRFGS
jgi:hypothetical protein